MKKYKPEYLGKVIPADNPNKLSKFLTKKYDSFSKIYDTVKSESENIKDIKAIDDESDSLSVKLTCSKETASKIKDIANGADGVTVDNDVVTAKK